MQIFWNIWNSSDPHTSRRICDINFANAFFIYAIDPYRNCLFCSIDFLLLIVLKDLSENFLNNDTDRRKQRWFWIISKLMHILKKQDFQNLVHKSSLGVANQFECQLFHFQLNASKVARIIRTFPSVWIEE